MGARPCYRNAGRRHGELDHDYSERWHQVDAERYTYVYAGRPTLVGLRGYAAYQAIEEFHATNQKDPRILQWMYGPVVQDGPLAPSDK